ncbi:putative AAA+ superfamily ATPase [Paraburkholderia youngii]|uniref:ATP-binding protein n=1 Tax=Paraburkholderia youngii TaxID=2782701 RepID=UPI003D1FFB02
MGLKHWREVAIPHEDVLRGTFQQAEFAADISRVHEGTAAPEYQDPALFYQRTFITEGMRLLLDSVVRRLAGKGGDPVIQLQTAFGGGKTHTMLAVYHLAKGEKPFAELQGIPPILDSAQVTELPAARIAVLDGIRLSPNQPQTRGDGTNRVTVRTMWGELAWQLGGESAYAEVKDADASGTSPGKEVLTKLLADHAPCVILMDELVAYIRQFDEGSALTGGTYDSNLTFIQALTESLKAVPTAVLLASLPESDREAGSQKGANALAALSHYFGRVQALWKPVATEEAFEIVRRRLFESIADRLAAEQVCRAYSDFYAANPGDFPPETRDSHYFERLKQAYPIHPEVFDRLYEDWSSLDNFQRTRGVLKLMAKVIHELWRRGNNDLLIQPASLPLYEADIRNEAIYYLPQGWDPVLERDIDGDRAATTELDNLKPMLGSIHACRRLARTIFLGSAPEAGTVGGAKHHRGLELERVLLGAGQPGQAIGHYKDGVRAMIDRLQYLNSANSRYWFDTRPNLRREMEDRKRRFHDKEHVFPMIRDKLRFAQGVFAGVHVFTAGGDVPDDWSLRLVVLPPDVPFSRVIEAQAVERAAEILRFRGEQPREKQNRLIFLAADGDSVGRLKDHVRSVLAWQSIVADAKDALLNLDQLQAKQASKNLEDATEMLGRMVRETYKWLLAPMQEVRPGKGISEVIWEHYHVNPSVLNRVEEIEKILRENELLITDWSPIHLSGLLRTWFWRDDAPAQGAVDAWQKSCCFLYMPRLRDADVFRHTIAAGAASRDFFGFAYGRDRERYVGFQFNTKTSPIFDESLLLIEPKAAAALADKLVEEEAARVKAAEEAAAQFAGKSSSGQTEGLATEFDNGSSTSGLEGDTGNDSTTHPGGGDLTTPEAPPKRRFYGTVNLDPARARFEFGEIVDEVLMLFAARADTTVRVSIEISAETEDQFDENLQRAVRENCAQLKFVNKDFEN